jgi:hypothetical protein
MPIFKGDNVKIIIDTGTNIGAVTVFIKFKKPVSHRTGAWATTKIDSTKVLHECPSGELNESGAWELQAYVPEWPAHGRIAKLFISRPLY